MSKAISKVIFAFIIAVFLSSCMALHSGVMSNSASLGSANFSYVKQNTKGQATATYILGIGGLGKETLVDNAKKQMMRNNALKSNQTYANLTVNFKSAFYFGIIYHTVTCTITADVVEFK